MKLKLYVLAAMVMAATAGFAQKFEVQPENAKLTWKGKKISSYHDGTINLKSGSFELKNKRMVKGEFVIDMTSIVNTDIENKERGKRLVGHLESSDFFNVEKHPTAEFSITGSTAFEQGEAEVTGSLTIKENTHPITFKVKRTGAKYTAKMVFDRSLYDVRYGSGTFFSDLGDKAILDEIEMDVTLVASPVR